MRHGETEWNRQMRIMGQSDVPLSAAGRAQCERTAALLADFELEAVVSSPLARALESARIISKSLNLPMTTDVDLEEVHFGSWQGKTYREIVRDPDYHAFLDDPVGCATPGGETLVDVQRRGVAAVRRAGTGGGIVVVSHGDVIRSILCEYLTVSLRDFRRIRVDNCGLSAVSGIDATPEVKFVNLLADPGRAWEPLHWGRALRPAD
jgi:broad specificity phosphatase PhoE